MKKLILLFCLITLNVHSQVDTSLLNEEFLEGLPPSVRDEIDSKNQVGEERNGGTFRTETSQEKINLFSKTSRAIRCLEIVSAMM